MSQKKWKLKESASRESSDVFPDFSMLGRQLLFNLGFKNQADATRFLKPEYEELHSPFEFSQMRKAAGRIWQAIEKGERICVYGDYDADAVTANAVLRQTFRYLGAEADSYIPDRFTEGYGLNLEAFEKIKNSGAGLVVTVDCGTNSTEAVDWCARNGLDLIITDHHEIIGVLPAAFAVINPKNPEDKYPYHHITGVGVAFKLACALLDNPKVKIRVPGHKPGWEKWLLDLVAIGTVADCHSLLGENRILVKYGLKVLAKTRWIGLRALMRSAGAESSGRPLNTYVLGFVVAPRLNAAGRLEHANIALDLLLETDAVRAAARAADLERINARRQDHTKNILSEAKEKILPVADRAVLVVAGDWNKGVVGLVAGKLAEEYGKPAIVLSAEGELATGSARTAGNFDVVEGLKFAAGNLIRFGGHKQAAGLTLRMDQLDEFYRKILLYADQRQIQADAGPVLELDAELESAHLNFDTMKLLESFEPFGVGNPKPVFLLRGLKILSMRGVGEQSRHMQMKLQKEGVEISSIAFNQGFLAEIFKIGDTIDAACELVEDSWNGKKNIKLRVVEAKSGTFEN